MYFNFISIYTYIQTGEACYCQMERFEGQGLNFFGPEITWTMEIYCSLLELLSRKK